jgi:hypothetical protein
MTRALALLTLAAASLHAAVIRGTVVENFTGKLLTRALVVLQPLGATPGEERTARTGRLGGFEFNVPAGVYLLKASRRGFLPIEYGQKRWNSAGEPIVLEESASTFLNIRLPRYGAVSGTVVDENEIGLPDHDVSVYRATKPPELIRQDKTDDRGQYRIGGLTPGKYLVRTGGGRYEDGSYLPTFSRETAKLDDAQLAEVFLEQQTDHIDIRPLPGQTYNLSVGITTDPPHLPVTLTLASPMGRRTVQVVDAHTFTGLAPGDYEVYAETPPDSPHQGAWQRVQVPGRGATLLAEPAIAIPITGDSRDKGVLWVRRRDLAGPGQVEIVPGQGAELVVGRWEILPRPPDGFHVSNVYGGMMVRRDRLDGWNEVSIARYSRPQIRIAGGAASVRGTVKDAPYAPVYLEAYDPQNRARVGELWIARADAQGRYRFENLGPGAYRILATFEYLAPETEIFDLANAAGLTVDAHGAVARDLDLWVIR